MNEKSRIGTKDKNELSGRQGRSYLSARVVSLIRGNDTNRDFSPQELIHLESLLRDEFQTNPWLFNVCKAIDNESVVVTQEELNLYSKHKSDGQEVCVTQLVVDELTEELEFLRERLNVLKFILKDLTEKLRQIRENNKNHKSNENENNLTKIWPKLRAKLRESLEMIEKDLTTDLNVKEPKDIAEEIVNRFNEKLDSIEAIQRPNDWFNGLMDDLALTEGNKRDIFTEFNEQFFVKLVEIQKNLMNLKKECLRIKEFYEINIRAEMSWRTDLKLLLSHLQQMIDSQTIQLFSPQTHGKSVSEKQKLIEEYSKLFEIVENQEFDELEALMTALKERIEGLSSQNN